MQEKVYTYCQICEMACGLEVTREHNRIVEIAPDKNNRNSWRDFCIKGASAGAVVEHPNRILTPMQRVGGRYIERSYHDAVTAIGGRLREIIAVHGAAAVGSYAGNPNGMNFGASLFLSLFMDAIGSHNRYWVGSLDQNALHYVAEQMYGHPFVTLQLDLDACASVLLIGANPSVSGMCWIGYNADGWKRLLAAQEAGRTRIVIADPRRTESARKAAIHLQTRPDSDWALCLALIKIIFDAGWEHRDDCAQVDGITTLREIAGAASLTELASCCDIAITTLYDVAEHFAHANGAAAIARTGSAIGRNGSLTEWLTHALNLITGNTDRAGGRFYNAGLIDPLLAGDEIFPPNQVPSRVRRLATVAGFHATAELADEIVTPGAEQIRALFIVGGNPVVSGPDGTALDGALAGLELLVAVDLVQRESHRHAEWLIPAAHWLEREEFHPLLAGLGERAFAQIAREVVTKPATVRHEWEFLRDLAIEMDAPLLGKRGVNMLARASRVIARLTGNPYHAFGPAWLGRLLMLRSRGARWRHIKRAPHGLSYGVAGAGALREGLRARGRTINVAPQALVALLCQRLAEPLDAQTPEFPLRLLSRRRRQTMNSWLSETTAGGHKDLTGDRVEIHPTLGARLGIGDGDEVRVTSATSALLATALYSLDVRADTAVMEQGWGSRVFDPASGQASVQGVNRNLLVANDDLDPLSSVPRLNGTPIRLEKFPG
jgi:formate dehydrogenase